MTLLQPVTEFFIEDTWTDVSAYVRADPGITIRNGLPSEGVVADPASCTFTLNNPDGRFTPRNTAGAYYPWITRNMPVRVTVGSSIRFFGYLSVCPPAWNANESVATVNVEAHGISRRLAHANDVPSPLQSAVVYVTGSLGDVTGYWPCEDGANSESIATPLAGGTPGTVVSAPVFASIEPGVMSRPIPNWNGAGATFTPAVGGANGEFTAGALIVFPATGQLSGGEELFRVDVDGTGESWRLLYSPSSSGSILLQVINSSGVEVEANVHIGSLDGTTAFIKLEANNDGANVDWFLDALPGSQASGTVNSIQVGPPVSASIGAGTIAIGADVGIGHLVLGDTNTALFSSVFDDGLAGYADEDCDARCDRVQTQYGVPVSAFEGGVEIAELGPQPFGSVLEILRDMEKANVGGLLHDRRTAAGMSYTTRSARYNETTPQIILDYSAGEVALPLTPVDDDQQLRNDVTIDRPNGSSARATLTAGALSVQDYPDGAGLYAYQDTLNIDTDDRLPYVADWVLALGTVDEARWPQVTIDLVRNPGLVADWDDFRPGGRVRIENLPALAGTSDVDLQMVGWTETITPASRRVVMNCVPGSVWLGIFELDDATYGELDVNRLAL